MLLAAPAFATQPIDSFEVFTSTTQAGGHPDLETRLTLRSPGEPEAAENVIVNLPEGLFGNPHAIPTCKSADFALAACPISSQAGVITIRANYSGDPELSARHGAGLRHGGPIERRDGPVRLHRPDPQRPDQHSRRGADRRRTTACA